MDSGSVREDVINGLKRLAFGSANDTVKLAFLGEDAAEKIDGLNLELLSEVRRGSGGTVEVKLVNRLSALELLVKLVAGEAGPERGSEQAAALLEAIDRAAARTAGDRACD